MNKLSCLRPVFWQSHDIGKSTEVDDAFIFFGNKYSSPETIQSAFPELHLRLLHQTHSDRVLNADNSNLNDADAHFSFTSDQAICIRTADCLPVFIYDKKSHGVVAIHAGWRGIENKIIIKAFRGFEAAQRLNARSEGSELLTEPLAFIGPHIGVNSFECGKDVALRLESVYKDTRCKSEEPVLFTNRAGKTTVSLLEIALAQLGSLGITSQQVAHLAIDTVTSGEHHSFRRDGERSGRQMSFICLRTER